MAIGAWYAGARALANTSGGGFALMEEGLSLAGMTETPVVVHIAQRPGPATGLPTRTAQEDLNLVLYAGHGEFPRVIYAPGTEMDGFFLTQKAFNMADKYQVPVFVLTDQYFMDALQNISVSDFDANKFNVEQYMVETAPDYKRYALTETGVSPRGIPGGPGLVCADSDEHDEGGRITESMDVRNKMMAKRWAKLKGLTADTVPPKEHGTDSYKYLIISWGSTYGAVREAYEKMNREDLAFIHYSQVYPLHPSTSDFIKKAQKVFVVEQNFTGQFAKVIQRETGLSAEPILKFDGIAFSVEELISEFDRRMAR